MLASSSALAKASEIVLELRTWLKEQPPFSPYDKGKSPTGNALRSSIEEKKQGFIVVAAKDLGNRVTENRARLLRPLPTQLEEAGG